MNCFNRVINVYLSQGMIENITIQSDKQNKINTVNFKKQQPYKTWCLLVNKRYEFFDHLDSRWFTDLILKNTVLWSKRNFVLPVLLPRAMKASLSTVESYLLWFNLILKKNHYQKPVSNSCSPAKTTDKWPNNKVRKTEEHRGSFLYQFCCIWPNKDQNVVLGISSVKQYVYHLIWIVCFVCRLLVPGNVTTISTATCV